MDITLITEICLQKRSHTIVEQKYCIKQYLTGNIDNLLNIHIHIAGDRINTYINYEIIEGGENDIYFNQSMNEFYESFKKTVRSKMI